MRITKRQSTFEYVKVWNVIPIPLRPFPAHFARHRQGTFPLAFPLNGRVPYRGRGDAREFQAMNLDLPSNCVATEPSTICDAIRVHAAGPDGCVIYAESEALGGLFSY